ncbi:hypothetical protein A2U01_0074485, partial [Trifolium medium]|nr:hypothetical protein [Trifolium medium]
MWMIPRLPPRDPTVVSESMIRRKIRSAPSIESLPDKGGLAASRLEQWQRAAS